ncbi:hypothetical protein B0T26DRAFT_716353 [Lasiosphaeria miniovina]|uniref:Uncharacterized protein n=1 Tax=Lasiosphaeria miniovina TaxID=1954250 RepID=A0AA40ABZ3_9PEZI|nr:uncharacterized protein B0T26DRAFT_716353 [Lasiosphaeria miniovina]KAK0713085.1 hypothetical protein B0T26DRAFT_716353 [Lasiosphaeria miniovina]
MDRCFSRLLLFHSVSSLGSFLSGLILKIGPRHHTLVPEVHISLDEGPRLVIAVQLQNFTVLRRQLVKVISQQTARLSQVLGFALQTHLTWNGGCQATPRPETECRRPR